MGTLVPWFFVGAIVYRTLEGPHISEVCLFFSVRPCRVPPVGPVEKSG